MVRGGVWTGALLAFATPALASECIKPDEMLSYLKEAFAERNVASASTETGRSVRLFTSKRGSWTLVEYNDKGLACVTAHGTEWFEERGEAPQPQKPPA